MSQKKLFRSVTLVLVALTALGCGLANQKPLGLATGAGLGSETPEQRIQRVANSKGSNWATSLIHNAKLDEIRRRNAPQLGTRHLLSASGPVKLKTFTDHVPGFKVQTVLGSQTLSSRVEGEIGFDGYYGTQGYFVAENGAVYNYSAGSNGAPAYGFTITDINGNPTSDTFPKAKTVVMPDSAGRNLLFVCSAGGTFYAIDTTTGVTKATYAMGGTNANVGFTASPCLDFPGSPSGKYNLYAVTNLGKLYQFIYNTTSNTIDAVNNFQLPGNNGALIGGRHELYRTSPLVVNNHILVGSWKRYNSTNRTLDKGGFYAYDVANWNSSASPVINPTSTFTTGTLGLPAPILVEPSTETDYDLNPTIAFVPNGQQIMMADVRNAGNSYAMSSELVVNPEDADSGDVTTIAPDSSRKLTAGIQGRVIINPGTMAVVFTSNALWKIDYSSPSYDAVDPWGVDAFAERTISFSEPTTTVYRKSHLGWDPVNNTGSTLDSSSKYIYNRTYPCIYFGDYSTTWVVDSNGNLNNSTGTSFNRFSLNTGSKTTPPSLSSYFELTDGTAATQVGGAFVSYAYSTNPLEILFSTTSNTGSTPSSTLWSWE